MNDTTPPTTIRSPYEHPKLVALHAWKAEQPIKRGVNFVGVFLCTILLALAVVPWILKDQRIDLAVYGPYVVIGLGSILLFTGILGGINRAATRRREAATVESTTPHTP